MVNNKLIILGSGPAGYAASIYAARAGLNPVIIAGAEPGGQLTTTTEVENWPGDSDDLQGPDLMERMKKHAKKFGVEIINDHISKVNLQQSPFQLSWSESYEADTLIIATGASNDDDVNSETTNENNDDDVVDADFEDLNKTDK